MLKILQSWQANAKNWITTIENNELESRSVTNKAIVDAVVGYSPAKVLDLGCGEGWLSRSLRQKGLQVWGADAIKELVDEAIAKDGEFYFQYTYEELVTGGHDLPAPFDAIVINFALLDKKATEMLIAYLPALLSKQGYLFIQTLHPLNIASVGEYKTGWKEGSWNGMKQNFVLPYQWYFRTMEDWVSLFVHSGYTLEALKEPLHPLTLKPLSVIFVLTPNKIS